MLTFVDCKLLRVITSGVSRLIAAVISKKERAKKKHPNTHAERMGERQREGNRMRSIAIVVDP